MASIIKWLVHPASTELPVVSEDKRLVRWCENQAIKKAALDERPVELLLSPLFTVE